MDEKLPPPSPEEKEERLHEDKVTRRTFMMSVGIALNAMVALAIATPVVAYLLGPVTRRKEYRHWIDIGALGDFQPGQTRLITYRNPFSDSWDGETANIPAYVRCVAPNQFVVLPSTARTSAVPSAGSPSRSSSCAPATAGSITPMAAAPPARPSAASSPMKSRPNPAAS
jgi:hypothetical protein